MPVQGPLPLDARRRRALFRSQHRGMKETDFLLGRFAEQSLAAMSDDELARFEALLEESDNDLLAWIMGRDPVPNDADQDLINIIKDFNNSI
ncbi:MAG: succinate dehydrogenase assembly factor 2 [Rhodospirillaceae bacterium]|jgi:antitoxin CptB